MADRLIFPIGFDFDKGIKDATDDWNGRASKKLEAAIGKTPINVKLAISDASLNDLQSRFDKIKISPLTSDAKASIREMATELRGLAKALESVQKVKDLREAADPSAVRAARIAEITKRTDDKHEESIIRQRKLAAQAEAAELRRQKAASGVTREYKSQTAYVERLIKRMAVYTSFAAVGGFLTKVREVTAQFELQRVSLGAIIQDQTRANQLFSEIKQFALKSPITIMDLTKYTKQVAAYRIETDKLFDTTKRLADVSVGLGVDMQRIVLAYGQVKAASYLRAAEIRQFTEAGIPLLELLAEKFSQLNGEAVTTEKVMDMVSKRMVGFEMVEQIFNDMTSAGGMFFNMQEKQGNTLYGMWAKLGDAAAIMYNEIGNTKYVNEGMKSAIQTLTDMMRNWRSLAREIGIAVAAFVVYKLFVQKLTIDQARLTAATAAATDAQRKHNLSLRLGGTQLKFITNMAAMAAAANVKAAAATNLFSASMYRLKAAFLGNWITAIIVGLAFVAEKLYTAYENAHKLENALKDIEVENITEQAKSVRNFESLAELAVNAADGSKKQRDALDELQRTYKSIIPIEQLSIENLRRMNHEYGALTQSIRQYIQEQMRKKAADEVIAEFGGKILEQEKNVRKSLENMGLSGSQSSSFVGEYAKVASDSAKTLKEKVVAAFKAIGVELDKQDEKFQQAAKKLYESYKSGGDISFTQNPKIEELTKLYVKQENKLNSLEARYNSAGNELGEYQKKVESLDKTISGATFARINKQGQIIGEVDLSSFLGQQMKINLAIKTMGSDIKSEFEAVGLAWDESWGNFIEHIDAKNPEMVSALDFGKIVAEARRSGNVELLKYVQTLQKRYNELIPQDVIVQTVRKRLQDIVKASGQTYDDYVRYQMGASDTLETYRKNLKSNIDALKNEVKGYLYTLEQVLRGEAVYAGQLGWGMTEAQIKAKTEELQAKADALEKLYKELPSFDKEKKSRQSDPRLQEAQNIVSEIEKLYNKSIELEKFMSRSTALDKMAEQYKGALAEMDKWAKKVGVDLTGGLIDEKGFLNVLRNIKAYIAKLPKSERAVLDLEAKIGDAQFNRLQKDLEEKTKQLAEKVSKTKTAREFFDKILEQTGDIDIATHLSLSIYGDTGEGLFEDVVAQIKDAFKSENVEVAVAVDAAIDTTNKVIDYQKLSKAYDKYQNDLLESNRKTAQDIISNGQKAAATQVQTWEKELAKAKDFEQKRTDVISTESQRRIAIIKATTNENAAEMARLLALSYDKQAQDLAKLSVDEFKGGEDYIKVFQDLDAVSGATLDRMQKRLEEMIETVKGTENVEGLKTLIESLEKIKDEKISRNPLQGMIESFKQYRQARKDLNEAKIAEAEALSAYNEERVAIEQDIAQAKAEQEVAQQRVNSLENQGKAGTVEYKQAQLDVVAAEEKVVAATKRQEQAQNKVRKAQKKTTDAADAAKGASKGFQKSVQAAADGLDAAADAMRQIADLLGIAEDTELGAIVDGLISGFQQTVALLTAMLALTTAIEAECWPILAVAAAAGVLMAVFSVISNNKVRKANKEIEAQQELIDRLQYAYDRLEKAAEGAFGGEYINNYTERLKALEKQEKAYLKQAEAEESKGKKADEDKIQDYKDAARDAADEIKDLKSQIAEQFLGTDIYSAARDFAAAWLDAYKSFSNTADAMREKFEDLMQNLIIETALGKVMETALAPFFKQIQNASTSDMMSSKFWEQNAALMEQGISAANRGASTLMGYFEQFGLISRDAEEGLTGISRDIASASEESINGLAAGINTQNFYISQIHADVQGIYNLLMQRQNGLAAPQVAEGISLTDLVTLQNQHLAQLPNIAQNTADTVARLDEMLSTIKGVIVPRGTRGGRVVNTQN